MDLEERKAERELARKLELDKFKAMLEVLSKRIDL